MMSLMYRLCAVFLFSLTYVANAQAGVIHDESIAGDLSDANLAPTLLMVAEGSNIVTGSTAATPLDRDIFSFTVGAGLELAAVILQTYNTEDDQGFFAVEAGNQISALFSTAALLGNSLIGVGPGKMEGDDVLDDLGSAQFGGIGFTGALPAGTYTFWIQETSASVPEYALDFQVRSTTPVPLPTTLLLLLPALVLVARRR